MLGGSISCQLHCPIRYNHVSNPCDIGDILPGTASNSFRKKLRGQVKGARAGFLLGAGSSYLAGAGYPLAGGLWEEIAGRLDPDDARLLSGIIVGRNCGLEEALDALDVDPATPFPLRIGRA